MKKIILSIVAIVMTTSTLSATPYPNKCETTEKSDVIDCASENVVSYMDTEEISYTPIYTDKDVVAVAQTLWGEARGCSIEDQKNVVRTICNRCDDSRFPDTPYEVVTQAYQYAGYSPNNPIDPALTDIAVSVLEDWSLKKQGVQDIEWTDYLWFTGNGTCNTFRSTY